MTPKSCRRAAAVGVAMLAAVFVAASPGSAATDPSSKDCDVFVQFDERIRDCGGPARSLDETAILHEGCEKAVLAMRAWKARDPVAFLGDVPDSFSYRRPDGGVVTKADLVESTRQKMAMTRSIDSIVVAIRVDTLGTDSAVVRSRQWFTRVVAQPEGKERRRFTSVTHRERWARRGERWILLDFREENQTARWEGEP